MAVSKGAFDSLFDRIVLLLKSYSDEQEETYQFQVKPDYYRNLFSSTTGAFVFPYFNGLMPGQKAGCIGYLEQTVNFMIDLFVFTKGTAVDGESYSRADEAAGARLRYLIQQVLTALYSNDTPDFNSDSGIIGKISNPSVTPVPPERLEQAGERAFAAARMTFSATVAFEPTELEGEALEAISVTADLWSAYIEPEQREET